MYNVTSLKHYYDFVWDHNENLGFKNLFKHFWTLLNLMLYFGVNDWLFVVMFLADIWRQYLHIPVGHALVNHVYIVVALRYVRASYNKLSWLNGKWGIDLLATIDLKAYHWFKKKKKSMFMDKHCSLLFCHGKCISYDKDSRNTVTLFCFGTCMWRLVD